MSKVLLVEDDNNLREIYEARLAAEGYEIITAQNGEEALVVAKQNHPDLIISDVMMPRISGFEMLDILRNTDELRETKVIMLTALGQSDDQARADKLGADRYLVKSQVTLEDIVNSAKELLGEVPATAVPTATAPPTEQLAAPVQAEVVQITPAPETIAVEPIAPALTTTQTTSDASTQQMVTPTPVMPTAPVSVADPDPIAPTIQPVDIQDTVMPDNSPPDTIMPTTPADQVTVIAQTTAAEEATVTNQIDNFANSAIETPGQAPTVSTNTVTPVSVSAANDKVLARAVDDLAQATSMPAEEAVPPSQKQVPVAAVDEPSQSQSAVAPEPSVTPAAPMSPAPTEPEAVSVAPTTASDSDIQKIAGKKVISPISTVDNPSPNLNELLAKEEAKDQVDVTAQPIVNGAPVSPAPAIHPGFDPNSIAL